MSGSAFQNLVNAGTTRRNALLFLSAVTLLALAPFTNKAFHIDDPLFIWSAQQIQKDPIHFYDFKVNWYGSEMAASDVIKNPPVASYYIALIAGLAGWNESRVHLAFLLPAVAAILGSYLLARRYCDRPILAILATLFTPAFLVSSTTIMCDVMMLAFWVWALVFWERGLRRNSFPSLLFAGALAGICALTKYFGVCLVPLMLVHGIVKSRGLGRWIAALLLPVAIIGAYEWSTHLLYGRGLFFDAASYASHFSGKGPGAYILIGLAFAGGCVFAPLCFFHLLWPKWQIVIGLTAMGLLSLLLGVTRPFRLFELVNPAFVWPLAVHMAVFVIAGAGVLLIPLTDFCRRRDADSVLLALWVVGTFIFATFLNWTTNARSLLPMVPAMGILVMRGIDLHLRSGERSSGLRMAAPLALAALVAVLVNIADYHFANSARDAAYVLNEKAKKQLGTLWFEGHWGFQYYMQALGAKPLDVKGSLLENGDLLATPTETPDFYSFPAQVIRSKDILAVGPTTLFSSMDRKVGAGFYASEWGPIPFAVGSTGPQRYEVYTITHSLQLNP